MSTNLQKLHVNLKINKKIKQIFLIFQQIINLLIYYY
jgi:hypothetical protein